MKRSMFYGSILLVCVAGLAGQAFADVNSLRGVTEIPVTESAARTAEVYQRQGKY